MKKISGWAFAATFFIVILYLQFCQSKPATVPQSKYDAMAKAITDTVHYYEELQKADSAATENATAMAVQANERADRSEAELTASQDQVQRLIAKINAARKDKPDTAVSHNYVSGCDSLQLHAEYQDITIKKFRKDISALKAAKQNEISVRDKTITDQRNSNNALQKLLDDCQSVVKEQEQPKAKTQLYVGFGPWFSKSTFFAGGEVAAGIKTKKDQLFMVSGGVINKEPIVGVKTFFKIKF